MKFRNMTSSSLSKSIRIKILYKTIQIWIKCVVGKPQWRKPPGASICRVENSAELDLKESRCKVAEGIHVIYNRVQIPVLAKTVRNIWRLSRAGHLMPVFFV
jgi:hypothetical protein